jgi:hypothetical protein
VVKIVEKIALDMQQPMGSSFATYQQTIIPWLPKTTYLHHQDVWRIHLIQILKITIEL